MPEGILPDAFSELDALDLTLLDDIPEGISIVQATAHASVSAVTSVCKRRQRFDCVPLPLQSILGSICITASRSLVIDYRARAPTAGLLLGNDALVSHSIGKSVAGCHITCTSLRLDSVCRSTTWEQSPHAGGSRRGRHAAAT